MAKEEKLRNEIDEKYKWDLSCIYKNEKEFLEDKKEFLLVLDKIKAYKGKIASSANSLYEFLRLDEKANELMDNLYVFVNSKKDEDVANENNQEAYGDVINLISTYNEETSFVTPELLKTDYDVIKGYIKEDKRLEEFAFDLELIYRYQKHVLSVKEEKLLSNIEELKTKYSDNFDIILNSIMDYGYIEDEEGEKVKLTNSNYIKYSKSMVRKVRKAAYDARYQTIKRFTGLISTDYEGNVRADAFLAKARNFESSLEMYLFPDGMIPKIYDTLLKVADDNLDILHKYFSMIKDVSNLDVLNEYDINVALVDEKGKNYSIEQARKMICEALGVLGEDYVSVLNKAFDENWIDYYSNKGKVSGYYQTSAVKGHPLVFGNYTDDYEGVSNITHELGHAVHTYYSNKNNQPHAAQYTILVAEIASLTNMILLSSYVAGTSNDKKEKLIAISNILTIFASNFFGTLSLGSVFEKEVHQRAISGASLSEVAFNEIYGNIRERYFGKDVKISKIGNCGWARISHFYNSFYYYKYAVGICGACYVAKRILSGDNDYLQRYLNFLKLGGSMMPLDELKMIDLDFTNTKVIEEGISYFDELIDKFIEVFNS